MLNLDYRDSRPIYEQIKEKLRKLIISGALQTDDKLPSVRTLASDLAINPNTIQRAYRELESEGYIYSIQGKGNFVSQIPDEASERIEKIKAEIRTLLAELRYLNVSDDEIIALLKGDLEND